MKHILLRMLLNNLNQFMLYSLQNKFKRLRRLEDDDSDNEGADSQLEREVIADSLFVGGSDEQVSNFKEYIVLNCDMK